MLCVLFRDDSGTSLARSAVVSCIGGCFRRRCSCRILINSRNDGLDDGKVVAAVVELRFVVDSVDESFTAKTLVRWPSNCLAIVDGGESGTIFIVDDARSS